MKKLLLHTCCAPCSVAVIQDLINEYKVIVYFFNPNIFPYEEYKKRKTEVIKICKLWQVKMIDEDYIHEQWQKKVVGLENEPEGGRRCRACFYLRLQQAAQKAKQLSCDIFATTLTSSRYKKAEIINPLGQGIGQAVGLEFLFADWKKDGRQERAQKLIAEHNIYQQKYCGCEFSIQPL
jgi:predicted adenine nucleotide alpha hydrolase (AANH) superfamily ATPase